MRSALTAFLKRQEIILPDTVGVGLQELVAGRAFFDTHPRLKATFVCIEAVLLGFDKRNNICCSVSPTTAAVWFRASNTSYAFMPGITIGFVHAVNAVVSHGGIYPFPTFSVSPSMRLAFAPGQRPQPPSPSW